MNKDTLQIENIVTANVGDLSEGLLFVDGDHMCHLSSPKEVSVDLNLKHDVHFEV